MKTRAFTLLVLTLFAVALPPVVSAADGTPRQRMEQRLPHLVELKKKKLAGENNRGLLEGRGTLSAEQSQLIEDENRDRETAYEEIAKRTGKPKEAVAKERAKDLAARAAAGDPVQAADGTWVEKK